MMRSSEVCRLRGRGRLYFPHFAKRARYGASASSEAGRSAPPRDCGFALVMLAPDTDVCHNSSRLPACEPCNPVRRCSIVCGTSESAVSGRLSQAFACGLRPSRRDIFKYPAREMISVRLYLPERAGRSLRQPDNPLLLSKPSPESRRRWERGKLPLLRPSR